MCEVEHCSSRAVGHGLCNAHYANMLRHEIGKHKRYNTKRTGACQMVGCEKPVRTNHLCENHYMRLYRASKKANKTICMFGECPAAVYREGHCKEHYVQLFPKVQTRKSDCSNEECTQPVFSKELCQAHFNQFKGKKIRRPKCIEKGCDRFQYELERCKTHYSALKFEGAQAEDFWSFVKEKLEIA
jgi:hypothetical protein